MPNTEPSITRLPSVPMTVVGLMRRPMADVQNYQSDVIPLLRRYESYKQGFIESLQAVPGNIYAVVNFNLKGLEPEWCRQRLNLFDMKVARCLLGKNWSQKPASDRPQWIAVPEQATFLHFNMIWDVPIQHQEKFSIESPGIWRDVVPSGQFHLQVIGEGSGDAAAARTYSGKTFHPRWTIDHTITSMELQKKG